MRVLCPHCQTPSACPDEFAGRKVKCKKCEKVFQIAPDAKSKPPQPGSIGTSPTTSGLTPSKQKNGTPAPDRRIKAASPPTPPVKSRRGLVVALILASLALMFLSVTGAAAALGYYFYFKPSLQASGGEKPTTKPNDGTQTPYNGTQTPDETPSGSNKPDAVKEKPKDAPLVEAPAEKTDHFPLKEGYALVPGLGGLLLLQEKQLRILAPDGRSVTAQHALEQAYLRIGERPDYFVALSSAPPALDLLDKKTLKQIRRIDLKSINPTFLQMADLVIHPKLAKSYVAATVDIEAPRYQIAVVDEKTGAVDKPPELFGQFLAIDPAGERLYVGYKDLVDFPFRFRDLAFVPTYNSIDVLLAYDLVDGVPRFRQVVDQAGGNGTGIRLSPDGSRLTYLSVVGYPMHSSNLAGFDPRDLKKTPVPYTLKDQAATSILA